MDAVSRVYVLCAFDQGEQLLETGGGVLLSGCDRDIATLTWETVGHHPKTVQLSYYVQEVGRNSSEHPTSLDPDSLNAAFPMSQTGSVFMISSPTVPQHGQKVDRATERDRGLPSPGMRQHPAHTPIHAPSRMGQRLPHPPFPQSELTITGLADREAPPLPQEGPDNGADMSGPAHVTVGQDLARETSYAYINTQWTRTTDTHSHMPHIINSNLNSPEPQTMGVGIHSLTQTTYIQPGLAASNFKLNILADIRMDTETDIPMPGQTGKHTAIHSTQGDVIVPGHSIWPLPYSPLSSALDSSASSGPAEISTTTPLQPGQSLSTVQKVRLPLGLITEVTQDYAKFTYDADHTNTGNQAASASSSSLPLSSFSPSSSSSSQAPGRTSRSPANNNTKGDSSNGTQLASTFPGSANQTEMTKSLKSDTSDQIARSHSPSGSVDEEASSSVFPHPTMASTQNPLNRAQSQHIDTVTHSPPLHKPVTSTQIDTLPETEPQSAYNLENNSNTYKTTIKAKNSPVSDLIAFSSATSSDNNWTTSLPAATATVMLDDVVQTSTEITISSVLNSDVSMTISTNMKGEEPLQTLRTNTGAGTVHPMHSFTYTTPISSPTQMSSLSSDESHGDRSHKSSVSEDILQSPTSSPSFPISTPSPSATLATASFTHTPIRDHNSISMELQTRTQTDTPKLFTSSMTVPTHRTFTDHKTTTHSGEAPSNTEPEQGDGKEKKSKGSEHIVTTLAPPAWTPSKPIMGYLTTRKTSMPPVKTPHSASRLPSQWSPATGTATTAAPSFDWSSPTTPMPKLYIVPDQPATIRVESIELLLQIILEDPAMVLFSGLEEDTVAWVEPYLQRAPGFRKLLATWGSGSAVQSLVEFQTKGALSWLGMAGIPSSLLDHTGLAQAVREGRRFRGSKVINITVGGVQGSVCDWLLQCPAGYECVSQPGAVNHSCSSLCHSEYCHHHGICTHHPGQLPQCHCLAGEDFWYIGLRCDIKMTRARLVGMCLAILITVITLIGILALVAVRRYRAILIQAKVDQTRSSYRRFNHFDELSGRFWLRSWAGSADSLDNPAFMRSDELLHLRALDRTCCYHDDTLSLASTCPSHGTHINTVYPHSSQYGWRGSEVSVGECVLDSGKASDLSVCSWPVEPIHWTPFPLLQQLASHSHRSTAVRASRPRSYCEGMELVDLGKSWTA